MIPEFAPPEFICGNTPEEIQERMMESLPEDIDDMPGGFPYDFTMPTALEKAELINFTLMRALMLMFPMWAWDDWLDYHAKAAGLTRREAGYASGEVTVMGLPGTQIPTGTVFATLSTDSSPSIEFKTAEDTQIGENGGITIKVVAVKPGKTSNVLSGTVVLVSKPIKGVTEIRNEFDMTGGTDREGDESLRERIQEANESQSTSFVGNDSDYIRWAKEVVGVGSAIVIPEWNGPGTVKLVVLDSNGQPANQEILQKVSQFILSPEDRLQRRAPIGAILTVVAPVTVPISYTSKVVLARGYTLELVMESFRKKLLTYYEMAKEEGILRYTKLSSLLGETEGVLDYQNFLINGETANLLFRQDEYPQTEAVAFTLAEEGVEHGPRTVSNE